METSNIETNFQTERNPRQFRHEFLNSFNHRTHVQLEEIKKPNKF